MEPSDTDEGQSQIAKSELQRPPLPPRPSNISFLQDRQAADHGSRPSTRAGLTSDPTTALSMTDVNSFTRADGSRELRTTPSRVASAASIHKLSSEPTSELGEDSSSIRSFIPQGRSSQETESIFGGGIPSKQSTPFAFSSGLNSAAEEVLHIEDDEVIDFDVEFEEISDAEYDEAKARALWKAKRKHFFILSAAGKPVYSRHGSDKIISTYVGVIQTIISSYVGWETPLRSFSAGDTKFVILSQSNLFLVAISSLPESEAQIRTQLDALYMQILSTLTLPTLTHMFSIRPSTDLRRTLHGTEVLLSTLADSFTRGSPSTLLSALESLRIRKSHRRIINETMVKARVDDVLYGLIVAGGRLAGVIRPKKHSLHPGDLHLIFNMLFEAEGIKAGGGDSFLPICLPGFNNTGYLFMYVSFLDMGGDSVRELAEDEKIRKEDAVAIILLSVNKESFEDLQSMKNYLVHELHRNGSLRVIQTAVRNGRPATTDIVPGTVLRHFLFKSKGNVQFFMPSFSPHFESITHRRQLFSVYHTLHASVHAKHAAVKVQHIVSASASALAWVTPMFELYCIAGPSTPRNALAQNANKVVQWIQREEERIFLIGGAVF